MSRSEVVCAGAAVRGTRLFLAVPKSGRGLPHSKTLRVFWSVGARAMASWITPVHWGFVA
jgi:hypothetical protein